MASERVRDERGYAMAALLVGMSVMAIMLSMAMPVWRTASQREREAELVFRGEQYARAVELYQRKFAGAFPPSLDILLNERMLRKRYEDPMTEDGEFQLLYVGQDAGQAGQIGAGGQPPRQGGPGTPARGGATPPAAGPLGGGFTGAGVRGGIMGVTSKSTATSLREYNGRGRYNEWAFVATPANVQAGTGTGPQRGQGPQRGGRGAQPGRQGQPPGTGPARGFPPPGGGGAPATRGRQGF
jgi:type II secretory pathway pseudopilin PulG